MTDDDFALYTDNDLRQMADDYEAALARIRTLEFQDEVHWKTRRSLLDELEDGQRTCLALMKLLSDEKHKSEALDAELSRCRAANVYDANAHRKAAELDVAVERIRELEAENAEARVLLALVQVQTEYYASYDNSLSLAIDALLAKGSELETR